MLRLLSQLATGGVASCARQYLLGSLVVTSSLSVAGCAAQLRQEDKDLYAARTRGETDPDMLAWLKGLNDCRNTVYDVSTTPVSYFGVCTPKVENEILASMKAKAEAEKSAPAKVARERAIHCFGQAPAVVGRSTYNEGKNYDVVKKCFDERAKELATVKASDDAVTADNDAYGAAEKTNTVDAWLAFITAHSSDKRVAIAARRVSALASSATGDAQLAIDEKLVAAYPAGAAELPPERRVLLIGPKGLRVRDVQTMTAAKISPKVILARINASTEPYKNFDGDELIVLKNLGVADDLVAAMVEVTTKVVERRRADEERQAMRAEIAALKAMIAEKKAEGGASKGETIQTKEGPMDVLASCAKRLAALKACDQIPFPGSSICSAAAESSFPCPTAK